MTKQDKDFFNEANEAQAGGWFKFDKIGDSIKGKLLSVSEKEAQGVFPAQMIYEIEKDDGEIVNVGISVKKKFVTNAMRRAKIGQTVGLLYESDFQNDEMKKQGLAAAKTIKVFLDASYTPMQEVVDEGKEVTVDDIPFE